MEKRDSGHDPPSLAAVAGSASCLLRAAPSHLLGGLLWALVHREALLGCCASEQRAEHPSPPQPAIRQVENFSNNEHWLRKLGKRPRWHLRNLIHGGGKHIRSIGSPGHESRRPCALTAPGLGVDPAAAGRRGSRRGLAKRGQGARGARWRGGERKTQVRKRGRQLERFGVQKAAWPRAGDSQDSHPVCTSVPGIREEAQLRNPGARAGEASPRKGTPRGPPSLCHCRKKPRFFSWDGRWA